MRWVIIVLSGGFVALVISLVIIYKPSGGGSRVSEIGEALEQPVASPTVPAQTAAPPVNTEPAQVFPNQPQQAVGPEAATSATTDAAMSLKEEHLQENKTQFGRALDFLAPAAAAPMIENPIASATVAADIPESTAATPVAPAEKRWRGAVLVPKNMLLATAHTTKVRIPRIEAHPLDDGNVRIWARIQNPGSEPVSVGVACTFRYSGQPAGVSRGFLEIAIPAGGYYDADFLSPHSGVETYTILVRSN